MRRPLPPQTKRQPLPPQGSSIASKTDAFVKKYNGKYLDFDHVYPGECVDLAQFFNKEIVGATPLVGNAKDIWNTYPNNYYSRVSKNTTNYPPKGSIVIWGTGIGPYGHIAIGLDGNANSFHAFGQNFPLGSPCHIQFHNYRGVLGWLVPKHL